MAQPEHGVRAAEQMARNDSIFREANERIESYVQSIDDQIDGPLPFLCECADMGCTEVLQLTAVEYEAVRRDPTHFLNARGHVRNANGWARVVEEFDRYTVVEKIGEAAEVTAELDPRAEKRE